MPMPGFNDFIKTTPKLDQNTNGTISTSNMNVTYLYAQYIGWLIEQQIKEKIPALDLLAQIHIINIFILNQSCDKVNNSYIVKSIEENTLNSYIEYFNDNISLSVSLAIQSYVGKKNAISYQADKLNARGTYPQLLARSLLCFVVGAALFGACFAPELSVAGIYSVGALAGLFIGTSTSFLSKAIHHKKASNALDNDDINALNNAVSATIHDISACHLQSLSPAVKATLRWTTKADTSDDNSQEVIATDLIGLSRDLSPRPSMI